LPEVLEPSEHALNGIAVAIEDRREAILPPPVAFGGMFGIVPFASTCLRIASLS